jgi:PPK2 family polyphosphate:nucleotide phosphotransferase
MSTVSADHAVIGGEMKIETKPFKVPDGKNNSLKKRPTLIDPFYGSKEQYQEFLNEQVQQLSELQGLLYAYNRYSLLLIFQAMDAGGKDGAIKHVMSGVNPQGCEVHTFKQPSTLELEHDFLWRGVCHLPQRGMIGIFNRSYYEEVLIVRVHPEILRNQRLPDELVDEKTIWRDRYRSIQDLEQHLHRNGTRILKFYLHISKEEQKKRLQERIDNPEKNWKFSREDVEERELWKQYLDAYEKCISETGSKEAPWYVVPADDKKNARLIISEVVLDTLRELKMPRPKLSEVRKKELSELRQQLVESE